MNSYGDKFRLSIFGESHGDMVGVVLDGVPAGVKLTQDDFIIDILRRKSGGLGTTPRIEEDMPVIASGVFDGVTTGAPILIYFLNKNTKSKDYSNLRDTPRPGHSDFVAQVKYSGFNDIRGGGHFSGRLTLGLVAAGVVAKKVIGDIKVSAYITEIGGLKSSVEKYGAVGYEAQMQDNWQDLLNSLISQHDSVGGIVECECNCVPVGLGEPFFESLESKIAHLVFSIPGTRGVEFGDGFNSASMQGSQHNDCFVDNKGTTLTNGAGGINGGISNGNPIKFRVAIKPTASIAKPQTSFNFATQTNGSFVIEGRHDCCIALRCPVVVEAISAIALANCINKI